MADNTKLDAQSDAVRTHLTITQGVIQRMAENSRSCKMWCVTLVAAILFLVARTAEPQHALIALIPTLLFAILDAYYLALERAFRNSFNSFVEKVHAETVNVSDLYIVNYQGSKLRGFLRAMFKSFSILPFYIPVAITVLLACMLIP